MMYYIFIVTVNKLEDGKKIAKILIENKLAACVNIIQNVISIYEWKGKIEEDNEYILLIKTTEEKSDALIQKIQEIHSYETPEIIAFKIEKGSKNYLNWIDDVVNN
ncbi:MAG: divalent-cation tolerance protein CutA [Promethearchaeota archaeon]|nr:MAG: divalent-cation tolerance protein CutA [Candidatus Lokiarchaeota archaeon]